MKRGEVYLVGLGGGTGAPSSDDGSGRVIPAVVVSRDVLNQYGATVLVAPIVQSAAVRYPYPSDVAVGPPEGGLDASGVILTAQVRAVPRHRLGRRLGVLGREVMDQVDRALRITFALDDEG